MKEIQSAKNPRIKELKKLHKKKYREEKEEYLLEGFHLIEEAASSDAEIKELFVTQRGMKEWGDWLAANKEISTFLVSDEVMDAVSDLPTPQGILAVMALTAEGTPDIYSTKVLRSMQGSNYHLPVLQKDLTEVIPLMKDKGFTVYGTELNEEAHALDKVEKSDNFAIIMGNEGQGVSQEILSLTDQNVYIPMKGNAESLNVGVAAGIVLYHFSL
ncbi:TPA: RNA methyltransferase [Enterococcus faecium]|nr:RNA methyltransferase [Enterococcus faecium]